MTTSVVMPENGTVLKWYRAEGDPVRIGDHICDVETDKTVIEIEAEAEGILQHIRVPEGTSDVEALSELAVIASADEVEKPRAQPAADPGEQATAQPAPAAVTEPAADDPQRAHQPGRTIASPLARRLGRVNTN